MSVSSTNNLAMQVSAASDLTATRPLAAEAIDVERVLIHAVRAVNASEVLGQENELTFATDRRSRRNLVRIVNKRTGEVVQQIPAEYVLRMAEEMKRG
jgi:uncharacterized FlaG/YvyC family protein